jgi:ABC-2 type transport system ATP-binding protein
MNAAIEIEDLVKVFAKGRERVRAVDGLSLTVARGEVFGLLGPNGAGKTTTVEICEGLQQPTSGSVRVLGATWSGGDDFALRQRVGVSLQETQFFEKQTVREILALFASFYDAPMPVEEAIEIVSLGEKANARSMHLSGGQRQRLAVACALVGRPELLFLDEPTTGLDPQSRRGLWEVVEAFQARGGTLLLTTHYMEEAAHLCDRVGIVDHGKLIALGTPAQLIASLEGEHVVQVSAAGIGAVLQDADVAALPGVTGHSLEADALRLTVAAPHVTVPALLQRLARHELALAGLETHHTTLEDVFVHLTGRGLRDAE